MIAVNIFRVADGKVAERWDVIQEEVLGDRERQSDVRSRERDMRFAL